MAKNTDDRASGNKTSSDEAALSARLGSLDQRLSEFRDNRKVETDQSGDGNSAAKASAMGRGFQLSSELIAGVVVGALIGWGFDRLLSTSPFGMIVFLLLGFNAGVGQGIKTGGVFPKRARPVETQKPYKLIAGRRRGRWDERYAADDRS